MSEAGTRKQSDTGTASSKRRITIRALLRFLVPCTLVLAALGTTAALAYVLWYPLPEPYLPAATQLYGRNGELVTSLFAYNRVPVALEELPSHLPLAVLAMEDARFFDHPGIYRAGAP